QGRWIAAAIINERMETAQIAASITLPIAMNRRYAGLPSANRFHLVQLVAPAAAVTTRPDPMARYITHRFPVSQIERAARKLNPWATIHPSTGAKARSHSTTSSRSIL